MKIVYNLKKYKQKWYNFSLKNYNNTFSSKVKKNIKICNHQQCSIRLSSNPIYSFKKYNKTSLQIKRQRNIILKKHITARLPLRKEKKYQNLRPSAVRHYKMSPRGACIAFSCFRDTGIRPAYDFRGS